MKSVGLLLNMWTEVAVVVRIMRIEIMHDHVDKDSEYGDNWANHDIDAEVNVVDVGDGEGDGNGLEWVQRS